MAEAKPQSPCNQVCEIDEPSGYCIGCGRTLAEITAWPDAEPARQRAIIDLLPDRLATLALAIPPALPQANPGADPAP